MEIKFLHSVSSILPTDSELLE